MNPTACKRRGQKEKGGYYAPFFLPAWPGSWSQCMAFGPWWLPMTLPGWSEPWVGGARLLPSRRDVPCSNVLVHRDAPPARREPRPTRASRVQGLKSRNLGPWILSQRERGGVRENASDVHADQQYEPSPFAKRGEKVAGGRMRGAANPSPRPSPLAAQREREPKPRSVVGCARFSSGCSFR